MLHRDPWSCLLPRTAVAVAVAAAVVAAAPALAQNTTAALGGRVTAPDGAPVAAATVTVTHVDSGSTTTTTTDADGRWVARGLRAGGPFTVTVARGGQIERREGVFLTLAETGALDTVLGAAASAAQVVTVTGRSDSERFNRSTMGAGTAIGSRELQAFASINRNLQDYARADPRLAQTDKDRGEISAAGQNSRYNSITVDGVRVNDTFGLEANGLPTIKQPISIDAIQAVQVNISNYDVTQQGYTGANINAVTKSGTNELRGSVYHVFRNDTLSGDRFFRRPERYQAPPAFSDRTTGFTLGGPIVADRLFFFVNHEVLKSDRNTPIFGPVGAGLTDVGITTADIDAARAAAAARGFDIGSFQTTGELSVKDTLVKLDWNATDAQRLSLRWAKTDEQQPIFPGYGSNTLSLSSRNFTTAKTLDSVVGQWLADWTDALSSEVKLSRRSYLSVPVTQSDLPEIQLVYTSPAPAGTATGNRTLRFGTEETRHFNRLETDTTNLYAAANWRLGAHEFKAGIDVEDNEIFNAFVRRAKGQYTFEGPDPAALLAAGNPTAYRVQVPRAGFTLDDAAANLAFRNTGLFVQDSWSVNRRLSVMAGVRVDTIATDDVPVHNAAAQAAFGLDNRVTVDGQRLVQPRLGFNWRLDEAGPQSPRTQLRGGVGLFQGSAASVWLANPYQNTGMVVGDFSCSGTATTRCPPGLFTANPATPATVPGAAAANVDFVAPGLHQPAVWKANLAFDTEVGNGYVLGAEALFTRVKHALTYRHLNLGAPTANAPDGRQQFWSTGGLNPACWNGNATPLTTGACAGGTASPQQRPTTRFNSNRAFADVFVAEETDKGSGSAVTFSVAKNVREWGLNWNAAYTRTRATEVSPLTSSTSFSQWANRAAANVNENVAADSTALLRHRVNASLAWSRAFVGKLRTSVGVFYEGRSSRPYSWTFNNDMNGDGISGNDLLYVPRGPGSGEVLFRLPGESVAASGARAEAKFWEIVGSSRDLQDARGSVVSRSSGRTKFMHNFDVRIGQELPGFAAGHKGSVTLDILNFGNLLNKKWGRIDEIGFSDGAGGTVRRWINYAGTEGGRMVYAVNDPFERTTRNNRGESAWAMQVTLRYEF